MGFHPPSVYVEMDEDIEFLESDPARVRSKAYDIVLTARNWAGKHKDTQQRIAVPDI